MGCIGEYHVTGVTAIMAGAATVLPLAVVASNVSRTRQGATPDGVVTTVALPNTTITGGVGPYTQLWTRQSGDSPTISDDELLNPTWSATVNSGDPNVSVWRVTVTDAMSSTASFDITVTLTWVQV
jgi:hypothetical protein